MSDLYNALSEMANGERTLDETYEYINKMFARHVPYISPSWKSVRDELIKAYQEYNQLLVDELNEVCGMAVIHGWKSSRYEAGKTLREYIALLLSKLPSPPEVKE